MTFHHIPVMLNEVLHYLQPERGGIFVDGTLGGGGHSEAILKRLPSDSHLYGIDRDPEALEAATSRLSGFSDRFTPVHGNFFDMAALLRRFDIDHADGIILDFGVSSHQLDTPDRGFSYREDAPLDMRMDQTAPFSARDLVNSYSYEQLCRILWDYGEERYATRIADRIVRERASKPIETTVQLMNIVCAAMPKKSRAEQQHPARRTFQAIRIEVNGELDGLADAVEQAHDLLNPKGRLVIITFHSLEDRIVKLAFRKFEHPCTCPPKAPVCVCGKKPTAIILTRKPVTPGEEELKLNPRASSSKLRAIEKI